METNNRIFLLIDSALEFFAKRLRFIADALENTRRSFTPEVDYRKSAYYKNMLHAPGIAFSSKGDQEQRLNVVIGSVYRERAYGGPTTLLQTAKEISRHYQSVRFLSRHTIRFGKGEVFDLNDFVHDAKNKKIEVLSLQDESALTCHQNEIFLCGFYKTVSVWEAYVSELRRRGLRENAFYYLIQDYEPGFSPYGGNYAQACETYSHYDLTHTIFNSRELRDYFGVKFKSFKEEYVIDPSLNTEMYTYLTRCNFRLKPKQVKPIRILIYGRPSEFRNCFDAIVNGLYLFANDISVSELSDFEFVSAGAKHQDIKLRKGATIRSLGKLTIGDYIEELERAHIGISLMESPHPSYPPLEMASFGLFTITNKFFNKNLSKYHRLIHSIDYPVPNLISDGLRSAVKYAMENSGKELVSEVPENMSNLSWAENLERASIRPIYSSNL